MYRSIVMAFCLPLLSMPLTSQLSLNEIELERVPRKKVCQLIEGLQAVDSIQYLGDLTPTCVEDPSQYWEHDWDIVVDADPDALWQSYKSVNPAEAWNGRIVKFGMLYSGHSDSIMYLGDHFSGMQEGQIIFVNLNLVYGLVDIPVVLEVTRVDDEERILEYCYLNCSNSEGTQIVQLHQAEGGRTRISHTSYYRSDSKFRDKNLYPFFHTKAILEFHRNVEEAFFEEE
jgi:hypothetical protein